MNHIFSIKGIIGVVEKFFALKMNRSSAALSYYLILTLFPMLICVQWILSAVGEDVLAFLKDFSEIIPSGAYLIIEDYLVYSSTQSSGLLIIGIATAIITGSSAFRILSDTLREIFESRGGSNAIRFALSFVYAIAFLVAIYVLGITVIAGRWLIALLEPFFELIDFINLLDLAKLWNWLRFVILNIISTGMLYAVYYCNAWRSPFHIDVLPGAVFGSLIFTVVSGIFSWLITYSVKYSTVYGSLASVIILMLWLYIFANVILIGALINKELSEHKNEKKKLHNDVHSFIKKKS